MRRTLVHLNNDEQIQTSALQKKRGINFCISPSLRFRLLKAALYRERTSVRRKSSFIAAIQLATKRNSYIQEKFKCLQYRSNTKYYLLIKVIACIIVTVVPCYIQAQINSWNHKLYTTSDGLPSNNIRNCVQDNQGFIWVATESGLCRFDGDEFFTLLHNPADSTSIPANFVNRVSKLPDGRLLVATGKGLYIMNPKTLSGTTLHLYTNNNWHALEDNVNQILIDTAHKRVIIFTSAAAHVFDLNMKKIATAVFYKPGLDASQLGDFALVTILLKDGNVLYYNRINEKLGLFNTKNTTLNNLDELTDYPFYELSKRKVPYSYNIDSEGNMWMYYNNIDTLFCVSPAGKLQCWPLREKYSWVQRISFPSASQMIWSCLTKNGMPTVAEMPLQQMLDSPGKHFSITSKAGFPGILANLFVDKDSNWWFACAEGLYFVKNNKDAFKKIELPVPYHNMSWQYVSDIQRTDNEHLLITTYVEHCFLYNLTSNTIISYLDSIPIEQSVYYSMNEIVPMDNGRYLILGSQDLTFTNKKLSLGFTPQNEFEKYYRQYASISVWKDKAGILWNSFKGHGLTSWDSKVKALKNYSPPESFKMPDFTGITEDEHGDLWLININQPGLIKLNRSTGIFEIKHNAQNNIAGYKFPGYIVSGDGFIYISYHDGIIAYNRLNGSVKNITMFEGLPSNITTGLFYYNHHLFISTENGWAIMNTGDYTIKVLKEADGITGNVTAKGYYLDTANGILYTGGKGNVYRADIQNLLRSNIPTTIVINELKVNDTSIPGINTSLQLDHTENNIYFNVSSIDFYSGINKKYFYRIIVNGDTSLWQSNKNNKKFNFINLNPGTYSIEVKSKNANNEWSSNIAAIAFSIAKPWYNTWWFYTLCIAAIASVVYALFRYRIKQISKMQRMQQRISADLHDDIGASLTSINILSQLSQQQKIDTATRNEYLQKMNDQTTEVTNALRDIVWSINPKNDKLDIILGRMKRYAAELLETKNMDYSFEDNIKPGDEIADVDIRQNLYLIFKEAVNNLAKYSGATKAIITLSKEANHIQLEVKDNGNGFDAAHITKGNGIENMQRRAKTVNAKFELFSASGGGTNIKVRIPLL